MKKIFENMNKIIESRNEQLRREEIVDSKLRALECVDTVNKYLFYCRDINRYTTKEIELALKSWNPFKVNDKINEELILKGQTIEIIEDILKHDNPCSELQRYVKKF